MKTTADMIKDQYVGCSEMDSCPEFWHLYAYTKGLEFVLGTNGSFVLENLHEEFKKSIERS